MRPEEQPAISIQELPYPVPQPGEARERLAFLAGAAQELETLLQLAEAMASASLRDDLRQRLDRIRAEMADLECLAREAAPYRELEPGKPFDAPVEQGEEGPLRDKILEGTAAFDFSALLQGAGSMGQPVAHAWGDGEPAPLPAASLAPAVLHLRVYACGVSFPVEVRGPMLLIGRRDPRQRVEPDLDLWPDDAVSRRHGQIQRRGNRHFYVDLGSLNGTSLNGRPLTAEEEVPLSPGDELLIGSQSCIQVLSAH